MSTADLPRAGFAGLGVMGLPMAINLAHAGVPVLGWNRSEPARRAAAFSGLDIVARPADLTRDTAVVFTMLPDLPHVRSILDGPDGLRADGSMLTTLVVMGTVSPKAVASLAAELSPGGIDVVDAPVSGGRAGAHAATLSIMVGAAPDAFARVRPYLAAMGATVRHMGPVGTGSLAKACNQVVVAATVAALAEAVLLAERGGIEATSLLAVLGGGLAASEVLNQKRRHLETSDFTGSGPASYLAKDLDFALASAATTGAVLPVTDAVTGLYRAVVERGLGHLDNSVALAALRQLATERQTGA